MAGGSGEITAASAFGVMVPILLSGLIGIIASLMQFFGLKDASADEENFKKGYIYALIGLLVSITFSVLSSMKIGGTMFDDLGKIVSNFVQIIVTLYVINGSEAWLKSSANPKSKRAAKRCSISIR
jgi:hypothetical protein